MGFYQGETMSARGSDTGYLDLNPAVAWPLRPWAEVAPSAESEAGPERTAAAEPGAASATKSRDRGASAVEWVVITAIVVAIVTGVGVLISNAVKDKARSACNQIASTDTTNTTVGTSGGGQNCK
jgi:Flp pilus assembly pilin Flp